MKKIVLFFTFLSLITFTAQAQTICDSISVSFVQNYQGVNVFNFNFGLTYTGNDTVYEDSITYLWTLDNTTNSTLKNPSHAFAPGNYEVCVQATYQALGVTCVKTFCDSVKVGSVCDSLTAISYSYTSTGNTFSFTSTPITYSGVGTLDPDSIIYAWNFDDGNSSTMASPTHTFSSGDYGVCLQNIYQAPGEVCSQSFCDTVRLPSICDSLRPSFRDTLVGANTIRFISDYIVLGPAAGTIDTTAISYQWDFGDGNTSMAKNPTHTFSPGTYVVCLQFTYQDVGETCVQTLCDSVTIFATCDSISPTFSSVSSLNTHSFTPGFTYSGSNIVDTNLMTYHWDFGNGDTSNLKYPTHEFISGTYTVCLTITYQPQGETCIKTYCDTMGIYSICDSITTSFSSTTTGLNTLLFTPAYSFAGTGMLDTTLMGFNWNFGDSSLTTAQKNPTHTFPSSGDYTVCMEFSYQTLEGTCFKNYCDTVSITSICDSISVSFTPVYISTNTLSFTPDITYTGPGVLDSTNSNYSWSFEDGTTSNQKKPLHFFTNGMHGVCLQFNYQLGGVTCIKTHCDTIDPAIVASVNELQDMAISIYPNPLVNGKLTVNFEQKISQANITLFDVSGTIVYQNKNVSGTQLNLNLVELSKGYYFLNITSNLGQVTRKVQLN